MSEEAVYIDCTFPKEERLKSKKKIEELFKDGSSFYSSPVSLKFLASPDIDIHQVLISVPKKYQKRAVDRNLIKRRIREAYRLNKHLIQSADKKFLLAILYLSKEIPTYKSVSSKLTFLLKRLAAKQED